MGAIHVLREEYRYYRAAHPEFRWLFLIIDLASLAIKLALFAGFLLLCWYIVSRSPDEHSLWRFGSAADADTTIESQVAEDSVPELTEERLAVLRKIAGFDEPAEQTDDVIAVQETVGRAAGAQVGAEPTGGTELIGLANAESVDQALTTPLQTAALQSEPSVRSQALTNTAGTANSSQATEEPVGSAFVDGIYTPLNAEDGLWVLDQNAASYTLQIALTANVAFLDDFARLVPRDHIAAVYPERRVADGGIQYSLSAGSFASKAEAEAALASLPANIKRYGAHSRIFDEPQSNISRFLR